MSYSQEDLPKFGVKLINSLINEKINNQLFKVWSNPNYSYKLRNKKLFEEKLSILNEFKDDPDMSFKKKLFFRKFFNFMKVNIS